MKNFLRKILSLLISFNILGHSQNTRLDNLCQVLSSFQSSSIIPNTGWACNNSLADPCDGSWEGIFCTIEGEVGGIVLPNSFSGGTISPVIGNLLHLKFLSLASDGLTGVIPTSLLSLSGLSVLNLRNNRIIGPIPNVPKTTYSSTLAQFPVIAYLDLQGNLLQGSIPSSLSNFVNLTHLNIARNRLTGSIPRETGSLRYLSLLDVAHNSLSHSLPTQLGLLGNLSFLSLQSNAITGPLPSALGSLKTLTGLFVGGNRLRSSLPSSLRQLTALQALNLSNNKLQGPIPSTMGSLSRLSLLDLSKNSFTGLIPAALFSITKLLVVRINENSLVGNIPATIGSLVRLEKFHGYDNGFRGRLPTAIGSLSQLTEIRLSMNQISGAIPSVLSRLTSLTHLYLSLNALTGTLPTGLYTLTNLVTLKLGFNTLRGTVSSAIGRLNKLTSLSLTRNTFNGQIIRHISTMTNLCELNLAHLNSSGTIPTSIGALTRLEMISLLQNPVSGGIPTTIGFLVNLKRLYISDTQLSSSLPSELGLLTNLSSVLLYNNHLVGTIPSSLGNLVALSYLKLLGNSLTGSIPSSLSRLSGLLALGLSENSLQGVPPSAVCREAKNLGNLLLGSNPGITCTLSCQTDVDAVDAPARCPDYQDAVLYELYTIWNLKSILLLHTELSGVTLISSQPLIEPSTTRFISVDNTYEYTIQLAPESFLCRSSMSFCDNPCCNDTVYGLFQGSDWITPDIDVNFWGSSFTIKAPDFYFVTSINQPVDSLKCDFDLSGYSLTITARAKVEGWQFDFSRVYASPASSLSTPAYRRSLLDSGGSISPIQTVSQCTILSQNSQAKPAKPAPASSTLFVHQLSQSSQGPKRRGDQVNGPGPRLSKAFDGSFLRHKISELNTVSNRVVDAQRPRKKLDYKPLSANTVVEETAYAVGLCRSTWTGISCTNGQVKGLSLPSYGITGTIPSSIGQLFTLTKIDLSGNQLSGSITTTIQSLSLLNVLKLSNNNLQGTVPSFFVTLGYLYTLDIGYNKLTGSVPSAVSANLQSLVLDGNPLTGEIPSELCEQMLLSNLSVSLLNIPSLSCFQERCWSSLPASARLFDSSLGMCVPTSSPTAAPTTSPSTTPTLLPTPAPSVIPTGYPSGQPSAQPSSQPSTRPSPGPTPVPASPTDRPTILPTKAVVVVQPLLTDSQVVAVSAASSSFAALLIAVAVFFLCCSAGAVRRRKKQEALKQLPVHRTLLYLSHTLTEAKLLRLIDEHADTLNKMDADGHTVLDIIFSKNMTHPAITTAVIYRLLQRSLPGYLRTDNSAPSEFGNERNASHGWIQAVQVDTDVAVEAVEIILKENKANLDVLVGYLDGHGRRCKDIAGPRCKEIMNRLLYLGERYEVRPGPPEHRSATSLVVIATDHAGHRQVALKFMLNRDQFQKEILTRHEGNFDASYVLLVLEKYDGEEPDPHNRFFRADAIAKVAGLWVISILHCDGGRQPITKHIVDHEHIAGMNWDTVKQMTKHLAKAVEHIHEKKIVHGDIKPLNVLLVGKTLRLTDFDASASFESKEYVSGKCSTGFIPPEMLTLNEEGWAQVRCGEEMQFLVEVEEDNNRLPADPSQDMWALGCVLYLLCTGCTLFHVDTEDNIIDQEDLQVLYSWDYFTRENRLRKVKDKLARNLLSLLLDENPQRRLSASRVLHHPFLTGLHTTRLQGERAMWDVFLSYRVDSDLAHAELFYLELTKKGLKVWWDRKCLLAGQNWEEGFCSGLVGSSNIVCLLSRGAIKNPNNHRHNWEKFSPGSQCDNVMLEWRLALELKDRGMLEGVYPVMIGDLDTSTSHYTDYFASGCCPDVANVVVDALELKLREHLDRESLGSPYKESESAKEILSTILVNQGGKVIGELSTAVDAVADTVVEMVSRNKKAALERETELRNILSPASQLTRHVSRVSSLERLGGPRYGPRSKSSTSLVSVSLASRSDVELSSPVSFNLDNPLLQEDFNNLNSLYVEAQEENDQLKDILIRCKLDLNDLRAASHSDQEKLRLLQSNNDDLLELIANLNHKIESFAHNSDANAEYKDEFQA